MIETLSVTFVYAFKNNVKADIYTKRFAFYQMLTACFSFYFDSIDWNIMIAEKIKQQNIIHSNTINVIQKCLVIASVRANEQHTKHLQIHVQTNTHTNTQWCYRIERWQAQYFRFISFTFSFVSVSSPRVAKIARRNV